MCVIITLPRHALLSYDKLKNATLNNPHGFGIVAIDGGKLEVYHRLNEKGNDPEEVQKALERFKDAQFRHLHLRYRTKGLANRENCHPFTVFKDDTRRIEFMHNGTLTKFQNPINSVEDKSDTKQYAENFLAPFLSRWTGDLGRGDIEDPMLLKILSEHFGYTCRGLLVSNDQKPLYLGTWTKYKDNEKEFIVSNDDYFDKVTEYRVTPHYKNSLPLQQQSMYGEGYYCTHGAQAAYHTPASSPSYTAEKVADSLPLGTATRANAPKSPVLSGEPVEEKKTEQELLPSPKPTESTTTPKASAINNPVKGKEVVPLKNISLAKAGRFLTPDDLGSILDITTDVTDFDSELLGILSFVAPLELETFIEANPTGAAKLLDNLIWVANANAERVETLQEDKERATKRISRLMNVIRTHNPELSEEDVRQFANA